MTPSIVLLVSPRIDLGKFLSLAHPMLGYSVSAKIDQSRVQYDECHKFLMCLASMADSAGAMSPNLWHHASYSILVVADERDSLDIISAAAGVPVVVADTVNRGVVAMVFTGTLAQWRDAVKTGASFSAIHNVRNCFCQIKAVFDAMGFGLWNDFREKDAGDATFYLEDKRK